MTITTKAVTVAAAAAAAREFLSRNNVAATKAKQVLDVSPDLMARIEKLEATPEEVESVADALSAFGDFIREALGQGEGKKPAEGEAATKSRDSDDDLSRDAHGVAITKPYGSTPADAIARKQAEIARWGDPEGDGRAADGRSTRKVFS